MGLIIRLGRDSSLVVASLAYERVAFSDSVVSAWNISYDCAGLVVVFSFLSVVALEIIGIWVYVFSFVTTALLLVSFFSAIGFNMG